MRNKGIIKTLAVELLDRGMLPSEVSKKLRARGYSISPSAVAQIGILRQARPEVIISGDIDTSEGIGQLPPAYMAGVLEDTWFQMPSRAQATAGNLVDTIIVTRSDDPRLFLSPTTSKPKAALYGSALLLPCDSEPEEIWHEVGHAIVDSGLTPDEIGSIERFYNFGAEQRSPLEVLAEDFYFTVKGDKASPFWKWWFMGGDLNGMTRAIRERTAGTKRTANDIDPLDIVEASLDAFADLVFDSGDERHIWYYGIALDALKSARKENQLAYENRGGPHQYYYREDTDQPPMPSSGNPMNKPLRVDQPDVTIRSEEPTAPGPGMV